MNNIVENIEYLVRRHDCVVIPTWGAFIARYVPASYNATTSTFTPPVRELSFNPSVMHDDGLLTSSVARHGCMAYASAARIVDREIESMRHQLEADGELSLGHVGRFVRQAESTVIFEPSQRLTAFESAGFGIIKAEPLIKQARSEHIAIKERRPAVLRRRRFARVVRVAAAVAFLALVTGAFTLPPMFDRDDTFASVTSNEIFSTKSSQTSILPTANGTDRTLSIPLPTAEEAIVAMPAPNANATATVKSATADTDSQSASKRIADLTGSRYCLVVASLPTAQLAERFIAESGDSSLSYKEMDGRFRVFAAASDSRDDLNFFMASSDVEERYPGAWICRMGR